LVAFPWAIWLLGTALVARREEPRPVVVVMVIVGALNAAIALYRLLAPS
jgi:hypothetical protein